MGPALSFLCSTTLLTKEGTNPTATPVPILSMDSNPWRLHPPLAIQSVVPTPSTINVICNTVRHSRIIAAVLIVLHVLVECPRLYIAVKTRQAMDPQKMPSTVSTFLLLWSINGHVEAYATIDHSVSRLIFTKHCSMNTILLTDYPFYFISFYVYILLGLKSYFVPLIKCLIVQCVGWCEFSIFENKFKWKELDSILSKIKYKRGVGWNFGVYPGAILLSVHGLKEPKSGRTDGATLLRRPVEWLHWRFFPVLRSERILYLRISYTFSIQSVLSRLGLGDTACLPYPRIPFYFFFLGRLWIVDNIKRTVCGYLQNIRITLTGLPPARVGSLMQVAQLREARESCKPVATRSAWNPCIWLGWGAVTVLLVLILCFLSEFLLSSRKA